ncbi:hypothetical protein [Pelagibius sp.]|uniref:hypothetical protein n=1 Tax=Pelagibius sp. TaxID=1931238 RepID=UPI003BB14543
MEDLATLGLEVDSRPVDNASKDLDRLSAAAEKAERATTGGLGKIGHEGGQSMDRLERASRKAADALGGLEARGRAAAGRLGVLGDVLATLGPAGLAVAATIGVITAGLIRLGKSIIDNARVLESLRAQLQTVTGSADLAAVAFDRILEFAKRTPFEVTNIVTAFNRLKAAGIDPTTERLQVFGDTAAAFGRDITDFSEAVIGAVTGETERLKQFGIITRIEGDRVRFTFRGLTREVTRDAAEIVAALEDIGRQNFAGGMARQSETLVGVTSNLDDAWSALRDTIDQAVGVSEKYKDALKLLTEELNKNEEAVKRLDGSTIEGLEYRRFEIISDLSALAAQAAARRAEIETLSPVARSLGFGPSMVEEDLDALNREEKAAKELRDRLVEVNAEISKKHRIQAQTTLLEAEQQRIQAAALEAAKAEEEAAKRAEEARKEAEKAAATAARVRKQALGDIASLEAENAAAGLDGLDALAHARDVELAEQKKRLDKGIILAEEFARARLAIEGRYHKEVAVLDERAAEELRRQQEREADRIAKDRQREAERATEKRLRDAEREAERQAEIMQQPFLNAIDGIQDSFVDFFEDVLNGGVNSFRDLADSAKQIMIRLAAEVAALLVFRPVVGGVLGSAGLGGLAGQLGASASSLPGGGGGFGFGVPSIPGLDSLFGASGSLTTALNSFGASLGFAAPGGTAASLGVAAVPGGVGNAASTGGLFGSTTFSSFLGGAGLGFGAGSLLNSLVGGNPVGGTIGSAAGGLAGAAIGSAILPGIGTVLGGLLGGSGGGLFGGLFGGDGRTVGPNAVASLGVSNGALVFGTANADNGGNRAEAERFARDVASTYNAIVESLGAEILNAGVNQVGTFGGQFRVGRAYNEGRLDRALGTDYRSAVEQSVLFGFGRADLSGIDPALEEAVNRAGQISKDLDEFMANISLAKAILGDDLFDVEEITQAEQAIKRLNATFEDAASRAEALGLDVAKVEDLHAKALQDMTDGFDEATQLAILGFTDPMQAALDDLAKTQEERLKEAEALGADLVALEKLSALERARVIEQSNNGLSDFLNEITFGGLSGAAPGNALSGARGAFEAAVAQGASAQRIISLGREFIGASRSFNASSTDFFEDLARVQAVVQSRIGGTGGANDNAAAAIAAASDRQALDAARIIDELRKSEEGQAALITALEDILAELKKQAA